MANITSREIRLASRPTGCPVAENFTLAHVTLDPPQSGQVLVRNLYMSVDPYMRGRMNDVISYVPPFELGMPLEGAAFSKGKTLARWWSGWLKGELVHSSEGKAVAGQLNGCPRKFPKTRSS